MKNLSQANYSSALQAVRNLKEKYGDTWNAIDPESAARMVTQNRFKTGLDIHSNDWVTSSEMGVRYNDPNLGITWPRKCTQLSARDRNLPFLESIVLRTTPLMRCFVCNRYEIFHSNTKVVRFNVEAIKTQRIRSHLKPAQYKLRTSSMDPPIYMPLLISKLAQPFLLHSSKK